MLSLIIHLTGIIALLGYYYIEMIYLNSSLLGPILFNTLYNITVLIIIIVIWLALYFYFSKQIKTKKNLNI